MNILTKVNDFLTPLFDSVDAHFHDFEPLNKLAALVRLRPAHIILTVFVLAVFALATGFLSNLFVAVFGMIYPAYMTFKVRMGLVRP